MHIEQKYLPQKIFKKTIFKGSRPWLSCGYSTVAHYLRLQFKKELLESRLVWLDSLVHVSLVLGVWATYLDILSLFLHLHNEDSIISHRWF